MKYRKKPVVVEATQWNKQGDHPEDACGEFRDSETGLIFKGEGQVVRYFRRPDLDGETQCKYCYKQMHVHGWIDTLEGGHIVCPGDFIITGTKGEKYPCKEHIFKDIYEPV